MEKDYVSYELSLALKACGFDEPCDHCYVVDKNAESNFALQEYASLSKWNSALVGGAKYPYKHISAPLLYHAQKWLREEKDLCVTVYAQPYNGLPYYTGYILYDGDETEVLDKDGHWFDDYEQALLETISSALNLLAGKEGEG